MLLQSQDSERWASGHLYNYSIRRSSVPPPRCEVNYNMFQSPDLRLGIPHRIGPVYKGTNSDLTPVKIPLPLPDLSYATFTCFSSLPYDIRHVIWKLLIVPRNLDIWPSSFGTLARNDNPNVELTPKLWRLTFSTFHPTILHISHESREIALKYYVLSFGTEIECPSWFGSTISVPPRIYYNLKLDRVCLMTTHLDYIAMDTEPWLSLLKKNFHHSGMSVALNLPTCYKAACHDSLSFFQIFEKHKDVIFYYLENPKYLQAPRKAVITFEDVSRKQINVPDMPHFDIEAKRAYRKMFTEELMKHYYGDPDPSGQMKADKRILMPAISWRTLVIQE